MGWEILMGPSSSEFIFYVGRMCRRIITGRRGNSNILPIKMVLQWVMPSGTHVLYNSYPLNLGWLCDLLLTDRIWQKGYCVTLEASSEEALQCLLECMLILREISCQVRSWLPQYHHILMKSKLAMWREKERRLASHSYYSHSSTTARHMIEEIILEIPDSAGPWGQ